MAFAVATLAGWIGTGCALASLYWLFRSRVEALATSVQRARREAAAYAVAGALLWMVATLTPAELGREMSGSGIRIPVVWFYAHFGGWLQVFGAGLFILALVRAAMAISDSERRTHFTNSAFGLALLLGGFQLFGHVKGQWTVFRGAFYLQPLTLGIVLLLGVAAVVIMAEAQRRVAGRTLSKTVATHAALLAGCVVFGLPFAWLLSSSFKEDRDVTGGVIWIPKVTQTSKYFDPKRPQYSGKLEGLYVVAEPIETLPDGRLRLDVVTPMAVRGRTFEASQSELKEVPRDVPIVKFEENGRTITGRVIEELAQGDRRVEILEPESRKGEVGVYEGEIAVDYRPQGLNWKNYPDALQYLPPETQFGWIYLRNSLILVVLTVIGTLLSCSLVAYAFSRLKFPGKDVLFMVLLSTMMLPGAVTLLPQFLIFKSLGWIDTLLPLWVPAFFASAFNVFMLRQFFNQIPGELEDAAKIDGCSYPQSFWSVMLPQVKPALAVVAIWTFMGTWNNFLGPLIYVNSPEQMPIAYALQLFSGERSGEPGLLMAFATMSMIPVLALFFAAQKYFIEGVTLSGLGGR